MKSEALTYSAACFERGASVPLRLDRFSYSGVELSPARNKSDSNKSKCDLSAQNSSAPLSSVMLRFWFWMQMQFGALLATPARELCSEPSHIFQVPSADPEAPPRAVRVNRSMMRRLKRLQRLRPPSSFDGPTMGDELRRLGLTMAQYIEYMIRRKKWSRVAVHRLGLSRIALMWWAVNNAALQGDGRSLLRAMACNARIEPD